MGEDFSQLGKKIVDMATGQRPKEGPPEAKRADSKIGSRGGRISSERLSAEERKERAKKASNARWMKKK